MNNLFDLNIKKVLENWSIADALREIIANALDETVLAKSPEIKVYKDSDKVWHIRDYGRGLQYVHLTQNENKEKLECNELIGKFGVGLKDALAVLYRKDCKDDTANNIKAGDLILVQNRTTSFYDYDDLCTGDLLPIDNRVRSCDTLDSVNFDSIYHNFNGDVMLYDVVNDIGKDNLHTFDTCHSTVNLLTNGDKLLNFLNTDGYNNLSDIGSFCYSETDKYGKNHDTKYTSVDGIKGLYFKCDYVSNDNTEYTSFALKWITNIVRLKEVMLFV